MRALVLSLSLCACGKTPEQRLARGLAAEDPAVAVEDLSAACDAGLPAACDAAGALPTHDPRKDQWDERACEGGIPAACLRRTRQTTDTFSQRACELGDAGSCSAIAQETNDPAMHRRACLAGHKASCLPAGDDARKRGDITVAAELYSVRCAHDPNDTACLLVERIREEAPAGELAWPDGDAASVSELLWSGCAKDNAWDCLRLAEHVQSGGPLPSSARGGPAWLRDQACDLQLVYACAPHTW